ncbi:LPXTG cell wall anchor domain-containing protein [Streptomyces sp. NPDC013740]|uniref:LPXTG cell wall anchor domain-containing protein n=1 Tax=Streptomyces sp. NPDC013740 TaxID=3364867 RepID=UPI0036FD51B3
MKIRRILATAVAAAVITPVAVLSAAPAFADVRQESKPTIEELRLAVTKARGVYDAAVAAEAEVQKRVVATLKSLGEGGDHPLAVAYAAAKKAAEAAATAKTEADAKLAKAQADRAALPEGATPAQKEAAQKAVDEAQQAVETAAATKTTADATARQAREDMVDAQVAAAREASAARAATEEARKALDAAVVALKNAEKETGGQECARGDVLAVSMTGPKKIVAGDSGVFTYRVTNNGEGTVSALRTDAMAFGWERIEQDWRHVHLTWSSVDSPKWRPVGKEGVNSGSALRPGESFDFRLKVSVDTETKAVSGEVEAGLVRFTAEDGSCGLSDEGGHMQFSISRKPGKPGKPGEPGKPTDPAQPTESPKPSPTHGSGSGTTPQQGGGSLATTGAGSSTLPIALAGGAAVVLGAGAMVVVRRRRAGSDV